MRAIARAALRDGESIRDEEVAVAAEAVGVGGREGPGGAMAIAAAGTREQRSVGGLMKTTAVNILYRKPLRARLIRPVTMAISHVCQAHLIR
jgi:hypothetical protein